MCKKRLGHSNCAQGSPGIEAAVHAMRTMLSDDTSEGVLLIDADNAFNRINRSAALWNVQYTCPEMKFALINFYRSPSRVFMKGRF